MAPIIRNIRPTPWYYVAAFIDLACSITLVALHYPKTDEPLGLAMYLLFISISSIVAISIILPRSPRIFTLLYATFFRVEIEAGANEDEPGVELRAPPPRTAVDGGQNDLL
jgi:hypothetical protein